MKALCSFSSIISHYVSEVIKDVNDGVISAWEGVKEIRDEYADLSSKAIFYAKNGIGVVAGAMQVEVGITVTGASYGLGAPVGAFFIGHGVNNMYEGGMNIYNGPDGPAVQGPTRRAYQFFMGDDYKRGYGIWNHRLNFVCWWYDAANTQDGFITTFQARPFEL